MWFDICLDKVLSLRPIFSFKEMVDEVLIVSQCVVGHVLTTFVYALNGDPMVENPSRHVLPVSLVELSASSHLVDRCFLS